MPQDKFSQRKKDVLLKEDKSSKRTWDKKIAKLCEKINSFEDYYTTSSCSGRIVVMVDQDKKEKDLFLRVYHGLFSLTQLKKDLNKIVENNRLIKFKLEPCILHVACESLEDAQKLLDKAKLVGWKRSGIISFGRNIVLELNSTEKLEFPIIDKNKILVDDDFLKIVVLESNKKLEKSWGKIRKLEKFLERFKN